MTRAFKILCIATGSTGNCYLIEDGECRLLIELGVPMSDILPFINYKPSTIGGCIISHRHSDHAKGITSALKYGINVYGNSDVAKINPKIHILGTDADIGGFHIFSFPLYHTVPCLGFVITTPSGMRILFATDTARVPYLFHDIDFYLIEANWSDSVLEDNMQNDSPNYSNFTSHLSLQRCADFLKHNFNGRCKAIGLIHLSPHNSDEGLFIKTIRDTLGFQNVVAMDSKKELKDNVPF